MKQNLFFNKIFLKFFNGINPKDLPPDAQSSWDSLWTFFNNTGYWILVSIGSVVATYSGIMILISNMSSDQTPEKRIENRKKFVNILISSIGIILVPTIIKIVIAIASNIISQN